MELTQADFAKKVGWTYSRLNEIVNGRRGISANSALTFANAFNMEAEFWLNLQRDWDLWYAARTHKKLSPILRRATDTHFDHNWT